MTRETFGTNTVLYRRKHYNRRGQLFDIRLGTDGQCGGMVYDAQNRMTSAVNGYHQYRYDADGKRTRKLVTGSPEMWLVYGVSGDLVAEYDAVLPGGTLRKEYGYRGGQMLVFAGFWIAWSPAAPERQDDPAAEKTSRLRFLCSAAPLNKQLRSRRR